MRYGIFSDVHANLEAMEAVARAYREESIDKYFCIGDVVGYGADPRPCIEKVKALGAVTVAGNHDRGCAGLFPIDYFNPDAAEALLWTRRQLDSLALSFLEALQLVYEVDGVTLVHGTLEEPQDFNYMLDSETAASSFKLLNTVICFVGHTHVAGIFKEDKNGEVVLLKGTAAALEEGGRYIVNAGSVGQPRDGIPEAAFCIYDSGTKNVAIRRVHYDIGTARKKIVDAGLPGFLGDRLLSGR